MLQNSNICIAQARTLIDVVLEKFSETESRLSITKNIFHTPMFDLALLKIQTGMQEESTEEEKLAVKFLLLNIPTSNSIQESKEIESSSFAERLLKRRKLDDWKPMNIDTRFIIPTTNMAERFFSKAGYW